MKIRPYRNHLPMALIALILCTKASADSAARPYHIPPQPLNSALMRFASDSNLELLYAADKLRAFKSGGLDGNLTPAQALAQLLQGSGMTFRFVDAGTVTIEPSNNFKKTAVVDEKLQPQSNNETGSETTLEKVTVEADSAYDPEYYADPYNKDYVLPNATAGTKTNTPVMETPLNVQVISKQVLKDQQVIRLDQALKNISGVTTATSSKQNGLLGGTQQSIFLRGFDSETFFRNGFRLQQGSASRGMANVESVEVLKGSAAILYGLVEPGGMVNIITKQPLATPYYGFNQQFGSYDLYRTTLDATGPVANNKDVLYRVNMSYENSGSFRDFVNNENVFLAPVLKWNISPQTQVTFEMEYNHQRQGLDSGFIPFIDGKLLNIPRSRNYAEYSPATTETIFGGFNWSHQFNDDWAIKHRFSVNQSNLASPFSMRAGGALTKDIIQGAFGNDPNLNLVPDNLLVLRDGFSNNNQNNTYSTNLDLVGHFNTAGLNHTLLLGGDYYRLDSELFESNTDNNILPFSYISANNPVHPGTPSPPFGFNSKTSNRTDQYGLYIQDQIKLPYHVQVMGGIRYQYIHQLSSSQDSNASNTNTPGTFDAVTPRVGILWQPKSWLSLYANYAENFGANNPDARLWPNRSFLPPTSATQYEGGIKTEFFDGKLRATLAYYDLTKTNVAASDLTVDPNTKQLRDCGSGPGTCSLALGEVRSRGPELDITGEILPGWNVIATWANTDIIVTKTNAKGDAISGISPGGRLTNVPRNTGNLWSTYNVQGGDFKGLTFGGGATLRDSALIVDSSDGRQTKLPGYATFNLMAGYSRNVGDAKVSVQLNINNLLDKHYFSSLSTSAGNGAAFADFGQPRTFMGSISVQY